MTAVAQKRGLHINQTKINEGKWKATSNTKKLEDLDYFGSMINRTNQEKGEVEQKIQAGHEAFCRFMTNRNISKNLKLKIYKSAIQCVIT